MPTFKCPVGVKSHHGRLLGAVAFIESSSCVSGGASSLLEIDEGVSIIAIRKPKELVIVDC